MKTRLFGGLLVAIGCALGLQPAAAATVTLSGTGTGSDGALGASAVFTTSAGSLAVMLSNTLAAKQIMSAGQAVSDLSFTLSNAPGTSWSPHCLGSIGKYRGGWHCHERDGIAGAVAGARPSPSGRHRFFQHRG